MVQIKIEVERRKKKPSQPEYEFLQKLEVFRLGNLETLIVVENEARTRSLAELFFKAEEIGIQEYFFNERNGKWWPQPDGYPEKFTVVATIGIWAHARLIWRGCMLPPFLNSVGSEPNKQVETGVFQSGQPGSRLSSA